MKISFPKTSLRSGLVATALLGGMALAPRAAHADAIGYNIGIDVGNLSSGNYTFYFNIADGDGVANTTMNFSNFTASGPSTYTGSGTPAPFILTDTGSGTEFNDSISFFSGGAGGQVAFDFTADFTASPDSFFLSVFDSSNADVPTADAFRSALFELNFDGSGYRTYDFNSGPSPTVRVTAIATPEPATWAMMLMGLALVLAMLKRNKKTGADTEIELAREAVA
jgi:hypothetical protein